MWEYGATLLRIKDGDSVDLTIDLGFGLRQDINCRLTGINTLALGTAAGKAARQFVADLLPPNARLRVRTDKDRSGRDKQEKYGRYLVTLWTWDDPEGTPSINARLLSAGHATPYFGSGPRG